MKIFFFISYSCNIKIKILFTNVLFFKLFSNFNFVFLYLYYLNNTDFLIKNKYFYYSNFLNLNTNYKFYKNFFLKNFDRFSLKNYPSSLLLKKNSYVKILNFLNFMKVFKLKNFFNNYRLSVNKLSSGHSLYLVSSFLVFHYKNMNTARVKFRNLEVFKLLKSDWFSFNLARLTKSSFKLENSDIFTFKNIYQNFKKFNIVPAVTSFKYNDSLMEKDFFFLNLFNDVFFNLNFFSNNNYFFWNIFYNQTLLKNFNNDYSVFFNKKKINNSIYLNFKNFYSYNEILNKNQTNQYFTNFFYFNKLESVVFFFFNPLFFKYFFISNKKNFKTLIKSFKNTLSNLTDLYFYSNSNNSMFNNILPNLNFNFILKKKILKIFSYNKFPITTTFWQYNALLRFLEFCSGRKVCLNFFNFLNNILNFNERAQCLIWAQKVKYFRKVLGPRLFLNESLQIIFLALKLKDPFFLSNWMVSTMYKISFWKYKMFLRYLKYVLRYFFWVIFRDLNIKGIKFQLKGKISVAGNARTRTVFHNVGFTSHTTFNNKILYHLNLVRSFTGVMGLKLWIVF